MEVVKVVNNTSRLKSNITYQGLFFWVDYRLGPGFNWWGHARAHSFEAHKNTHM